VTEDEIKVLTPERIKDLEANGTLVFLGDDAEAAKVPAVGQPGSGANDEDPPKPREMVDEFTRPQLDAMAVELGLDAEAVKKMHAKPDVVAAINARRAEIEREKAAAPNSEPEIPEDLRGLSRDELLDKALGAKIDPGLAADMDEAELIDAIIAARADQASPNSTPVSNEREQQVKELVQKGLSEEDARFSVYGPQ
jgi:hypothetical protein